MKNWTLALTGRALLATVFASLSAVATAQMTPVGQWHSSDEKTGELKSLIIISETGGVLNGHVDKLLRKTADQKAVCKECTDDRKDKPMLGLQIIRGAKKVDSRPRERPQLHAAHDACRGWQKARSARLDPVCRPHPDLGSCSVSLPTFALSLSMGASEHIQGLRQA